MIIQPINNIAELCSLHGMDTAVIAPGSRSAAITIAFARHPDIQTYVIPDERTAGFIAMGMAQASKKPVAIICTSGTAATNLYPAIIEAYYQNIPLLVFTADRPPEWIDQQDGQTIRQKDLFRDHIKASYSFPDTYDHPDIHWHATRMISEAYNEANGIEKGPVHINVPVREPFYPKADEPYHYEKDLKIIKIEKGSSFFDTNTQNGILNELSHFKKILIVAGQQGKEDVLLQTLDPIVNKLKIPVIGDIISNVHSIDDVINQQDQILTNPKDHDKAPLIPDLVITFGKSILSKNLKLFLRHHQITHWHIGTEKHVADAFQSLTKVIQTPPPVFFDILSEYKNNNQSFQDEYFNLWQQKQEISLQKTAIFFEGQEFSEFEAVKMVLGTLPKVSTLHLANSMPVRYANMLGLQNSYSDVYSNRGASGIDGCTSTFVGHAIKNKIPNVLITGDMAFFYDRNALWHSYSPDNLKIVILNNHGGGIFRMIDGPSQLPELEAYFETNQGLIAQNMAKDYNLSYFYANSKEELKNALNAFWGKDTKSSILEIETSTIINKKVFTTFKKPQNNYGAYIFLGNDYRI